MVYRCDCRFLLYSLHFSEFMLVFFTRKRTKHEHTRSPPFFVWYENGRRRLLGAQSINTERTSLRANGLASRRKPTQVSYLRSTCVSFGHPLAWTLVEFQFVRKSTQAHASPRKSSYLFSAGFVVGNELHCSDWHADPGCFFPAWPRWETGSD